MKNKGFTLVELLAVIAILAILIILAMPNVIDMFNKAKVNTFVTDVQKIMDTATGEFTKDVFSNEASSIYYSTSSNDELNTRKLEVDSNKDYFIEMDRHGNFKRIVIYDENYCYDIYTDFGDNSIGDISNTKSKKIIDNFSKNKKITKNIVSMDDVWQSGNDSVISAVIKDGEKLKSYLVEGCDAKLKFLDSSDDNDNNDLTNDDFENIEGESLYDVLASFDGLYTKKYSGLHQDSYNLSATHDIYHFYAESDAVGTEILEKNNVLFANYCWQILRTTDIGGVRMIYNGHADSEGKCGTDRTSHEGYKESMSFSIKKNYYYGDDYEYDPITNKFKLTGNVFQSPYNDSTYQNLIGKYTNLSDSGNSSSNDVYLIKSGSAGSNVATLFQIQNNLPYYGIGKMNYNKASSMITNLGYMYNSNYVSHFLSTSSNFSIGLSSKTLLNTSTSFSASYFYADDVSYNSNKYILNSPVKIDNSSNIKNKYSLLSSNSTSAYSNVYYILHTNSSGVSYYKVLSNGDTKNDISPIVFGDLKYNSDGSYSIINPISVSLVDWIETYSNYVGKYTCGSDVTTCSSPYYVVSSTSTEYKYLSVSNVSKKLLVAKSRNGLTLQDTKIINYIDWANNYSSYSDYKYTCGNTSSVCTNENLKYITSYNSGGLVYRYNRVTSKNIKYENGKYKLLDNLQIESGTFMNSYICLEYGQSECSSVAYIFDSSSSGYYYYLLEGGIMTEDEARVEALSSNKVDSNVKMYIDMWYERNLISFSDYLEDSIYCNDRVLSITGWWHDNHSTSLPYSKFKNYDITKDLSCFNDTDKFSVSNPKAKLKYPIALPTAPELKLLNNNKIRDKGSYYWTMTPSYFYNAGACIHNVFSGGNFGNSRFTDHTHSVTRPVITLKNSVKYISGDGSTSNPFVIG